MPSSELKRQVRIAYEAATDVARSADDSDSKPRKDLSPEAPSERPWEKLDGIFARGAQQRQAAVEAAAQAQKGGAAIL